MVLFGQVVVGPPGAGKTTYCNGMQLFLQELERPSAIINLDFANDVVPYTAAVDIRELITLQDVMEEHRLGPNGGLIYCMEYLLVNIDWLHDRIEELSNPVNEDGSNASTKSVPIRYFVFDFPGQVELYSHHSIVQDMLAQLMKRFDFRLCSVYLIDSFYCTQPAVFISAALLVISTMLRLALPHISVLSKVDLIGKYGQLPFKLDFFTEMLDLAPLLRYLDAEIPTSYDDDLEKLRSDATAEVTDYEGEVDTSDTANSEDNTTNRSIPRSLLQQKFHKLTEALCEVVDDYGLVSFLPMNIEDAATVGRVLAAIDKANGYSMAWSEAERYTRSSKSQFGSRLDGAASNSELFNVASQNLESLYDVSIDIQEKYTTPQPYIPTTPSSAVRGTAGSQSKLI